MSLIASRILAALLYAVSAAVLFAGGLAAGVPLSAPLLLVCAFACAAYYLLGLLSLDLSLGPLRLLLAMLVTNILISIPAAVILGAVPSLLMFSLQFCYQALVLLLQVSLVPRRRSIAVVGSEDHARQVIACLQHRGTSPRPRFLRAAASRPQRPPVVEDGPTVSALYIGAAEDPAAGARRAAAWLRACGIRDVVLAMDGPRETAFRRELRSCAPPRLNVVDDLSYFEGRRGRIPPRMVAQARLGDGSAFPLLRNPVLRAAKRGADIVLSLLGLLLAAPLLGACAVLTKLGSPGPVLYVQPRTGRGGKAFRIYKFRTMLVHDPERHPRYASTGDPRIPPVGAFLRKSHLDELPQLYNILRGDMSWVGPRAEWTVLSDKYLTEIPHYGLRHTVRPGLSGWAQVNYPYGVSVEDAEEKLAYDLFYLVHASLLLDLIVLARTVRTVLFVRGT